jgi:putative acetyltransferase
MLVREAVPDEAEAVRSVHEASIRGLGPAAYTPEQVDAWARGCESADYTAGIASEDLVFLVATNDTVGEDVPRSVVGFGTLSLQAPAEYAVAVDGEVTGVYVHPEATRQGVGASIYNELEERARSGGLGSLGLSASKNAVSFYEHLGYDRVRERDHEFSSQAETGVTGQVVEMQKDL